MALASMSEIFERMARNGQEFWEVVLADDMDERQVSREASMAKMLTTWQAMQDAADSYTGRKRSVSGLVGGDGMKMRQYTFRGCAMTGGYVSEVIAEALSMAESNACMRRIVAAPTAGACGVLPAVLLPLCKYEELTQHQLLEALYVAAVTSILNQLRVNVANMSVHRHKRGGDALMVIETDQHIKPKQVEFISELPGILGVTYYDKEDDEDGSGFDERNL